MYTLWKFYLLSSSPTHESLGIKLSLTFFSSFALNLKIQLFLEKGDLSLHAKKSKKVRINLLFWLSSWEYCVKFIHSWKIQQYCRLFSHDGIFSFIFDLSRELSNYLMFDEMRGGIFDQLVLGILTSFEDRYYLYIFW